MFFLLWPLVCTTVWAQDSGGTADFGASYSRGGPSAKPASRFHLKGVLVSRTSRSALVNGKVAREGDRIAGVEILAIDEGEVRILIGSRELVVNVGATVVGEEFSQPDTRLSRGPAEQYGPVMPGETLSDIAEQYLRDGMTTDQMMIALFEANPQAFSNNINRLREGAVLRIPDGDELRRQTPEMASAEVVRQTKAWHKGYGQHAALTLAHTNVAALGSERIH